MCALGKVGTDAAAADSGSIASGCGGDASAAGGGAPVNSGGMAATAAASGEEGREEEEARRETLRASLMDMVSRSIAAHVSCLVLGLTSAGGAGAGTAAAAEG